jgi:hypothetical protein
VPRQNSAQRSRNIVTGALEDYLKDQTEFSVWTDSAEIGMLLFSEPKFNAGNHDHLDVNSLVMVTLRQPTSWKS